LFAGPYLVYKQQNLEVWNVPQDGADVDRLVLVCQTNARISSWYFRSREKKIAKHVHTYLFTALEKDGKNHIPYTCTWLLKKITFIVNFYIKSKVRYKKWDEPLYLFKVKLRPTLFVRFMIFNQTSGHCFCNKSASLRVSSEW